MSTVSPPRPMLPQGQNLNIMLEKHKWTWNGSSYERQGEITNLNIVKNKLAVLKKYWIDGDHNFTSLFGSLTPSPPLALPEVFDASASSQPFHMGDYDLPFYMIDKSTVTWGGNSSFGTINNGTTIIKPWNHISVEFDDHEIVNFTGT